MSVMETVGMRDGASQLIRSFSLTWICVDLSTWKLRAAVTCTVAAADLQSMQVTSSYHWLHMLHTIAIIQLLLPTKSASERCLALQQQLQHLCPTKACSPVRTATAVPPRCLWCPWQKGIERQCSTEARCST